MREGKQLEYKENLDSNTYMKTISAFANDEGENLSFEEITARNQDLTFNKLEQVLIQGMNIEKLNSDILKTLELYSDKTGFNVAAELLADKNSFMGIDVIRFGENIDEIMERKSFEYISILDELEQVLQMFRRYYQYEKIEGTERNVVDKIPEKAFREAIANALVHRMWDVKASIKVSMYSDRIEINSPGGLPEGINEEEYLNGQISILRNPIIGNVFFRLKYIEKFGTGIMRINYAYKDAIEKPKYKVFPNSIQVVLPVFTDMKDLSTEEKMIWKLLREKDEMTRSELAKATGLGKDKTIRVLNGLLDKNVITRRGAGRGVKYREN